MGEKLKSLTEKFKNFKNKLGKKTQLAVALILSLIMLIIFIDALKKPDENEETTTIMSESSLSEDYALKLENRLENLLLSINGINNVDVFIMTETSTKTIYAVDEKREEVGGTSEKLEISSTTEIVFSKDGSVSKPIVAVEVYPEIVGVLIVADTKKDEKTRLMILNAVSVALGVNNSKIEVLLTDKS